ncbi:hypothetical protein GCM10007079_42380 [Nocardiopsis terrae]|uniref:DUF3558 domain-containing protein n=1 Tax=Nocardiopsis terrae TaxID=372655 RepID=A0ABR9HM59_9ACTN|nr:hypothetical protein [Nocardiopsis terrae]MBE1459945.1 hypothetical protein [Nocardiopsis terrae]GHC93210.1 hypothetical protein GCM10007079_42380 [Nocardiopsis terrae]
MADTREADPERRAPAKKGLHGWKAAGAVFGCGTLAAFGVFGAIVGILSLFLNTLSSGVGSSASGGDVSVEQTGEPIVELEPGELNLCEQDVQYSHDQADPGYVSENFDDPALDGNEDDRVVSDQCDWEITPKGDNLFDPWYFLYSYEAVVSSSGGASQEEVASLRYDELVGELAGEVNDLRESGEVGLGDRSYFHYGMSGSEDYVYYLIGQTRSTVYVIHFEAPSENGEVDSTWFTNEARVVAAKVEPALQVLVPE